MRRAITFAATVTTALVLGAAPALAGFCFVENKPVGPGQQAVLNVADGSFDILNNSADHRNENSLSEDGTPRIAGFLGVDIDGDGTADAEFLIPGNPDGHLPQGALEAGPDGESQCDGHGVGNLFVCLGGGEPEH